MRLFVMSKRGQIWDTFIPWIIAIAVLVIGSLAYLVLSGKTDSMIQYFSDLVRFR